MIWFIFSILCALFLNTSLAPALGFEAVTTTAFLPMMLVIAIGTLMGRIKFNAKENKLAIWVLVLAFVIFVVKFEIGQDYFKTVLTFLAMPVLISIYLERCSRRKLLILQYIVLFFFLTECLLAIYERVLNAHVFRSIFEMNEYLIQEIWEFRSQAFLGHPLANAMVVAVLMTFIVTNQQLKLYLKLTLAILGYIALFCFNARGATIVATFLIIPYLFCKGYYSAKKKIHKFLFILFSIIIIGGIIYMIFNTNLGGRLINSNNLLDGSAMTRVDVFKFYKFLNSQDLWFGNPDNYIYITRKLGAGGVENGIIVLILQYGIVLTIPLLILLFRFHWQKLKRYPKIEKWLIISVFYVIGIMNPNLASPIQWTIFIFGYYSFINANFREPIYKYSPEYKRI